MLRARVTIVEYCSKKAMLYKIQRGKWLALVSAKIVQRNLIVLSYRRILVCAGGSRFVYTFKNTQGPVIDMVWPSHGLHKRESRHRYRIFSIKRRTRIKRRLRINAGSKLPIFK